MTFRSEMKGAPCASFNGDYCRIGVVRDTTKSLLTSVFQYQGDGLAEVCERVFSRLALTIGFR